MTRPYMYSLASLRSEYGADAVIVPLVVQWMHAVSSALHVKLYLPWGSTGVLTKDHA